MTSGELIRARRQAHRLSQRQLAVRAGTSQAAIAQIESGRRSPTFDTLEKLLMAMGEELDLEGAVRPSRWRDHDEEAHRAFLALSPSERLQAVIDNAAFVAAIQGQAHG